MQYGFPSLQMLQSALAAGVLPRSVVKSPVRLGHWQGDEEAERDDADRPVAVQWPRPLSKTVLTRLRHYGVRAIDLARELPTQLDSILQAIPLECVSSTAPQQGAPILLKLSDATLVDQFVSQAFRLGHDGMGVQGFEAEAADSGTAEGFLLRIANPPYYLTLEAIERSERDPDRVQVFHSPVPGLWIAAGYAYPFAEVAAVRAGKLLLIDAANRWTRIRDRFLDVSSRIDLVEPRDAESLRTVAVSKRFRVELQLRPAAQTTAAQLWVVRGEHEAQLDELVASLPASTLDSLLFAVGESQGRATYVLRMRGGRDALPELPIDALSCRAYLNLPFLFVPCDRLLHPTLRRDVLSRHFARITELAGDDAICWLVPEAEGRFRTEIIQESAFQPLSEWVDYVIDRDRTTMQHWVKSATFEFDRWVVEVAGDEIATEPAPAQQSGRVGQAGDRQVEPGDRQVESDDRQVESDDRQVEPDDRRVGQPASDPPEEALRPDVEEDKTPPPTPARPGAQSRTRSSSAAVTGDSSPEDGGDAQDLAALEQEVARQLLSRGAGDEELAGELLRLAQLYDQLGRFADSLACRLRVAWRADSAHAALAEWWWPREQRRLVADDGPLGEEGEDRFVASDRLTTWGKMLEGASDATAAYGWASLLIWLEAAESGESGRASSAIDSMRTSIDGEFLSSSATRLEAVEEQLPVRARWLAWRALARLAGNDSLLLARARDRMLQRLAAEGVRPQLDVPSALREAGRDFSRLSQDGPAGTEVVERVGPLAVRLVPQVLAWLDDPESTARTEAYAKLAFAWALRRLAEEQRAEQLTLEATEELPDDAVHGWLLRAWQQRLEEAAQGLSPNLPLAPQLSEELESMDRLDRFKIERYLEHSAIVRSQLRHDPFERWSSAGKRPWDEEVAQWASESSGVILERRVRDTWQHYEGTADGESRRQLLLACLGASFRIGAGPAAEFLAEAARLHVPQDALHMRMRMLEICLRLSADFALPDHFDRFLGDLKQSLVPWVETLATAPPRDAELLSRLISRALVDVIRMGRDEDAASFPQFVDDQVTNRLIRQLDEAAGGEPSEPQVTAAILLLEVASCQWFQGEPERAVELVARVEKILRSPQLAPHEAAVLARAWARAFRYAPLAVVADHFRKVFQMTQDGRRKFLVQLHDDYMTSTHFSLSQLGFVERVVTTLAGPRLQLSPIVRSWIERDEVEILRQVHRDVDALVHASADSAASLDSK